MKRNIDYILYIIAGIYILPILLTFIMSLETVIGEHNIETLRLIPERITLRQYYLLFIENEHYIFMYWKSIKITLIILIFHFIYSIFIGTILAKLQIKGNKILVIIYIIGSIVPYQIYMLSHYIQFNKIGIFDTDYAIIIPQVFSPFGVVLISLIIRNIPDELIEVIKLETSSLYKLILYCIIPNIKGGVSLLIVLTFSKNWNLVEEPLIMIKEQIRQPLSVFLSYMNSNQEIIFAACLVYILPSIILYTFFEEYLNNIYIQILNSN